MTTFPGCRIANRELFEWAFLATEKELFDAFALCSRDQAIYRGDNWMFIQGNAPPESRVLLVAHVDTVRGGRKGVYYKTIKTHTPPTKPYNFLDWDGSILKSTHGVLGADDRAGIAALWALNHNNEHRHSILLLDLEEVGGVGAKELTKEIDVNLISDHAFAIEPDRYGDGQAVFYSGTSSKPFKEWLGGVVPFRFGKGSYTDIATICPWAQICGVNVSIGYLYQHTSNEILVVDAWERGVNNIQSLLDAGPYPTFQPDPKPKYVQNVGYSYAHDESWWAKRFGVTSQKKKKKKKTGVSQKKGETKKIAGKGSGKIIKATPRDCDCTGYKGVCVCTDETIPVVSDAGNILYWIKESEVPGHLLDDSLIGSPYVYQRDLNAHDMDTMVCPVCGYWMDSEVRPYCEYCVDHEKCLPDSPWCLVCIEKVLGVDVGINSTSVAVEPVS